MLTAKRLECWCLLITLFGAIPSLSTADLVNVALNKPASADSVYSTYYASKAVDGLFDTHWSATSHGSTQNPHWLVVDLGQDYAIEFVELHFVSSSYVGYTNIYNLYHGPDGANWTLIGSGTLVDTNDPHDKWETNGESMRYLKYEVVGGTHWSGLSELEAFTTAIPEPFSQPVLAAAGLLAFLKRKRRGS